MPLHNLGEQNVCSVDMKSWLLELRLAIFLVFSQYSHTQEKLKDHGFSKRQLHAMSEYVDQNAVRNLPNMGMRKKSTREEM